MITTRMSTPKCDYCGRFVSSADLVMDFTPDTSFSSEIVEHYHTNCKDALDGWQTRRARVEQTLSAIEQIAERMRETAEGLRVWDRNGRNVSRAEMGAGSWVRAMHPMHAANRLDKLANQLAVRRTDK